MASTEKAWTQRISTCRNVRMNSSAPPAQYGKPLIGVHFNGRPISSDTADRYLDAILEAWNPSETGAQAVTDVLLGAYNPGGKMPVSTAYSAGQIPIYYNHPELVPHGISRRASVL